MVGRDLLLMVSGALLLVGGYLLCYYSNVKKIGRKKPNEVFKSRPHIKVPDKRNQLETAEVVKPVRPGKKEK